MQNLALSLHIAFLVLWTAALMYLPVLTALRARSVDDEVRERLHLMERWMYAKVMTPSAILTIAFGIWLLFDRGFAGGWLPVKLALVFTMVLFHVWCGQRMARLADRPPGARRHRLMPVVPVVLATIVILLAAAKPF